MVRAKQPGSSAHKWEFKARFRRHAFGWKSHPAIERVKQAVSEIQKVARRDSVLAAGGAVSFLERVSPALEHVDSSSGAIGAAVNRAIAELVPIIATAPADHGTRQAWLERLFEALAADEIPYIEVLGTSWGELCGSKAVASAWADRLLDLTRLALSRDKKRNAFFFGTTACLSALYRAERYAEIVKLLEVDTIWSYQQWSVKALMGLGKKAEAIRYAESCRGPWADDRHVAALCEEILLSSGLAEESYQRYGLLANRRGTYLATFRAVAKRYPHKEASEILSDLVTTTPGEEGKWFAAAEGRRPLSRSASFGAPDTLRSKDADPGGSGFCQGPAGVRGRRRRARAALAGAGLRLRDHGRRRVGGICEHDAGGGSERHRR